MHSLDLPKQIVVHFCERKGPVVGLAMIGWDSSSIFRCLKPVKYKINVHILKMHVYMYVCTHTSVHTHKHTHTHTHKHTYSTFIVRTPST